MHTTVLHVPGAEMSLSSFVSSSRTHTGSNVEQLGMQSPRRVYVAVHVDNWLEKVGLNTVLCQLMVTMPVVCKTKSRPKREEEQ